MLLKIISNVAPLKLMDRFSGQRSFLRDACVSYWASAGTAKKRSRFQNFTFKRIHIGLICLFSFILLLFFFPLKRLNIGMRGRVSRDPPAPCLPAMDCAFTSPCSAPAPPCLAEGAEQSTGCQKIPLLSPYLKPKRLQHEKYINTYSLGTSGRVLL